MRKHPILFASMTALAASFAWAPAPGQTEDLRKAYAAVLQELSSALRERQVEDPGNPDFGAIQCEHCGVLHTRAAEAVYPFAVQSGITGDTTFQRAAILAGNWLMNQQQRDGSWKETPEEWTGTTTDQLLMMALAFSRLSKDLSSSERERWRSSIEGAADYLYRVMEPEFASINYVATTAATLVAANMVVPKKEYLQKARELAHRTISKMDADGFIDGEGGRSHAVKLGVDLGYDMEMSLWGLGYYAKECDDTLVAEAVRHSLRNHLFFIYPDGSMDNSWGIRSNKWTTYGGVTSDGCQVLFSLFSSEDPRYVTAAARNLKYLTTNMKGGIVGYGPHQWDIFDRPPCIYPTFTKAKNIAFAYELEREGALRAAPLPAETGPFLKYFKTLDLVLVRTEKLMATVTAYGYKDV
ncbi:MAG: hypothetical protein H6Q30_1734, partial [Bacteroidetes bacterium]|nr:hypothetical protein [Bacteroidota bacterium]